VDEPVKGVSAEDHIRQLRRYKAELVRDLAYGTVRLPSAWLTPGDATIIALDAEARLDADQDIRFKALLDQCMGLVDLIESLISGFITQRQSTGMRFAKNDLESLRRGRGPGRIRDLLFLRLPNWPDAGTGDLDQEVAAELWRCVEDRRSHQQAKDRDPRELQLLIQDLMPEVQRIVLEWARFKRLCSDDARYVLSEVLDQFIRTVAERNQAPGNLVGWCRTTAKWKWRAAGTCLAHLPLGVEAAGPDDVHDLVSRRVDMDRRLHAIARDLHERAQWFAALTPPRPDDALTYDVAARLVGLRRVELLEAIVRGLPEGISVVSSALMEQAETLSAGREAAVIQIIRDTLRRHLDTER
jgi:hypothetical protein